MVKKYKLPKGVNDILPEEYPIKAETENKLLSVFESYGYSRIDTPVLEYAELFSGGNTPSERLFKLTDFTGELLALRHDLTTPVSRIVSTKLTEGLYKFCYKGKCFDFLSESNLREFTQVGVELIGNASVEADSEVVVLAIESLLQAGISDFQLDIGHIGFFKGLLSALALNGDQSAQLIEYVEKKDAIGEEIFARENNLDQRGFSILQKLPSLFGGKEVLSLARDLCLNAQMDSALDYLSRVYDLLKDLGYEKYISFDLSLVGGTGYYTGIVFQGITKYFGWAILSGGRYDELCSSFDKNIPAVGFAMNSEDVVRALKELGNVTKCVKIDYLFAFEESCKKAYEIMDEYRNKGYKVSNCFAKGKDTLLRLKKQMGADKAVFVDSKLNIEIM